MIKFTILLKEAPRFDSGGVRAVSHQKPRTSFKSLPEVQQYVRKYVQGHTQPVALPGMPPPAYEGTTELWFDTAEDIAKVFSAPSYMEIIRPDEEKFLDLPGCGFLVCTENQVINQDAAI